MVIGNLKNSLTYGESVIGIDRYWYRDFSVSNRDFSVSDFSVSNQTMKKVQPYIPNSLWVMTLQRSSYLDQFLALNLTTFYASGQFWDVSWSSLAKVKDCSMLMAQFCAKVMKNEWTAFALSRQKHRSDSSTSVELLNCNLKKRRPCGSESGNVKQDHYWCSSVSKRI